MIKFKSKGYFKVKIILCMLALFVIILKPAYALDCDTDCSMLETLYEEEVCNDYKMRACQIIDDRDVIKTINSRKYKELDRKYKEFKKKGLMKSEILQKKYTYCI